ncbi:MAG TPA: hypothetical protein VNT58_09750 [Gaiellaceae bacterium]|nr:hypothetical protein [Gaiellaceae bacterium]
MLSLTGLLEPVVAASGARSAAVFAVGSAGKTTPPVGAAAGSRPYATATNDANATNRSARAALRPPWRVLVLRISR